MRSGYLFTMKKCILFFVLFCTHTLHAQYSRTQDDNAIYWLQTVANVAIHPKWTLYAEQQLRQVGDIASPQQRLLRLGLTYKMHPDVNVHAGYGFVKTFAYGDYPIAADGAFPEHRIYEQITFKQPIVTWTIQHRFRLEQRWLAKLSSTQATQWVYLNRIRYQFRAQKPLLTKAKNQVFAAVANEVFIGAGKQLGTNIFDQNRFSVLLGYSASKKINFELGYLYQILQQGKPLANNSVVMQHNSGLIGAAQFSF
jgi:long-subunit fatty acid transport protein